MKTINNTAIKKVLSIMSFVGVLLLASLSASASDTLQTASGIKYVILHEGSGAHASTKQTVKVVYCRKSSNGRVVESNELSKKPFKFKVDEHKVIDGINEVVKEMNEGEKLYCIIPPELGHGKHGKTRDDKSIAPNSTLYYYIEVVDIK